MKAFGVVGSRVDQFRAVVIEGVVKRAVGIQTRQGKRIWRREVVTVALPADDDFVVRGEGDGEREIISAEGDEALAAVGEGLVELTIGGVAGDGEVVFGAACLSSICVFSETALLRR